jgi:hypothetical protein
MEAGSLLPRSQEPLSDSCPEADESSLQDILLFL